jgi:hypothetical protein
VPLAGLDRTLLALALLLGACERTQPPAAEPECNPNAFRACELDACRGVQQCLEQAKWSDCDCIITDATFPEAAADAPSETGKDAESDLTDASTDAGASDAS